MNSSYQPILTPAYGRDYTSEIDVLYAYNNGSDFILNDLSSPYDGKPCSCRDFPNVRVKLRFSRLRKSIETTWETI